MRGTQITFSFPAAGMLHGFASHLPPKQAAFSGGGGFKRNMTNKRKISNLKIKTELPNSAWLTLHKLLLTR